MRECETELVGGRETDEAERLKLREVETGNPGNEKNEIPGCPAPGGCEGARTGE